jgi:hypothetical protein
MAATDIRALARTTLNIEDPSTVSQPRTEVYDQGSLLIVDRESPRTMKQL